MKEFLSIFKWSWYDPEIYTSLGLNYNTGYGIDENGEPNGDVIKMLEMGIIIGGLTIFIDYIPAEEEE